MQKNYPYLHNKKALEEIRKHKWIESEKKGRDIGFASAALEWINKFGREWRKYHTDQNQRTKH